MNIFNIIWSTLTSQNIFLVRIATLPLIPIEILLFILVSSTVLDIVINRKQLLLYVTSFSLIAVLTQFLIPTPFNAVINIIVCPVLIFFILKTSVLKTILAEILPYIVFAVLSMIFQYFFLLFFDLHTNQIQNIPIYRIIFSTTNYFAMWLLYLFIRKLDFNINLTDVIKRRTNFILVLNLIVGIITITIIFFSLTTYSSNLPTFLNLTIISALIIYFILSMYSLYRTDKLEVTAKNLEDERLYNKTLTILHDNIRGFKHDFNNIVNSIGGYIFDENLDGLREYYSELLDDCQRVNNLTALSPNVINNPAIYSLITSKYHKAEELGIKINVDVFMDLSNINMKIYELTRTLGILIDNSVEAANECEDKTINIIIRKDNKSNRQLFIIENTYSNKDVDTDKIFEKGYTSKTDTTTSHGLGLWEVRRIMRKNNNLNLFTTKDSTLFIQQLEIYL